MCGICGFIGRPDSALLTRMCEALTHRGPDEAGEFMDGDVSLAARRLAIVDLAAGRQPMSDESRNLAVVFNGEIYNAASLRSELQTRGRRFASRSDTECILQAYQEWGEECVRRLEGMFAFVLFDRTKRRLFGARDRFGEKPLYYYLSSQHAPGGEQTFVFASELKSLRLHPLVARHRDIDLEALVGYLSHDYVVGGRSIWQGIQRLPAAHAFVYKLPNSAEPMEFRTWRYWENSLAEHGAADSRTGRLTRDEARTGALALKAAVEARLMADVPIGVFLSGGIDSATVLALLKRLRPGEKPRTFSIGFNEATFDESHFARSAAHHFGAEHHERVFTTDELLAHLPTVVRQFDEPLADPSVLPFSALCQFARQEVKVALGGDGGDEVFAGYDPLRALGMASWYDRLVPHRVHRHLVASLLPKLPTHEGNLNWPLVARRFLRGAYLSGSAKVTAWMGAFDGHGLARLLPDLRENLTIHRIYAEETAAGRRFGSRSGGLPAAIDYFQRFYLTDDILVKVDRGSMAHGIEVRTPWLELRLVELLNALPSSCRRPGKAWLKQVVGQDLGDGPLVPRSIIRRKKKGFGMPVAAWIRSALRPQMERHLLHEWPAALDMFDRPEIRRLLQAHLSHVEDNHRELWALFMLAQWAHEHSCPI